MEGLRHDYELAAGVAQSQKQVIAESLETARTKHTLVCAAVEKVDLMTAEVEEQRHDIAQNITDTYGEIVAMLEKSRDSLLSQNDRKAAKKHRELSTQKERLEEREGELGGMIRSVEEAMTSMGDSEFLMRTEQMKESVREVTESEQLELEPIEIADTFIRLPNVAEVQSLCRKTGRLGTKVDPAKCTLSGNGLHRTDVKKTVHLNLHLLDYRGNRCIGDEKITCELKIVCDGTSKPVSIERSLLPASYRLAFMADTTGRHELHVMVSGVHIAGSPFRVLATLPPKRRSRHTAKIDVHHPIDVTLAADVGSTIIASKSTKTISVYNSEQVRTSVFSLPGEPSSITTDHDGNIFVTDVTNNKLHKYSKNDEGTYEKTKSYGGRRQLQKPCAVKYVRYADDNKPELYVCDTHNVWVFDTNLWLKRRFATNIVKKPTDITTDQRGNIYIADTKPNKVFVVARTGKLLREINMPKGIPKADQMHLCYGRGQLFIAISTHRHSSVELFNDKGDLIETFGKYLGSPRGITVSREGRVYVADYSGGAVFVF